MKKYRIYLIIFLFLCVGVCLYKYYRSSTDNIPFDSHVWQTSVEPRHLMRKDLERNHLKKTDTLETVETILGKPDRVILASEMGEDFRKGDDGRKDVERLWEYRMSMNIDPPAFCFIFDCHVFRVGFDTNGNYCHSHVFIN